MREPLRQDIRSVSRIETREENTDRYQNPVEEGWESVEEREGGKEREWREVWGGGEEGKEREGKEGKEDEEGKGIRASVKFGHAGRILPQHQP